MKLQNKIRLLYRRLKNIRTNYVHQVTNKIVKAKPSKIVMEHLNIKEMMQQHFIARSFATQCLYEFKRQMIYKCSCGLKIDRDLNAAINLANYQET